MRDLKAEVCRLKQQVSQPDAWIQDDRATIMISALQNEIQQARSERDHSHAVAAAAHSALNKVDDETIGDHLGPGRSWSRIQKLTKYCRKIDAGMRAKDLQIFLQKRELRSIRSRCFAAENSSKKY